MPAHKINPARKKVPTCITLPQYQLDYLKLKNVNRSDLIETAIREHYNLREPVREKPK